MLPLSVIVHRSREYEFGEENKKEDYMYAACLELNIGAISMHLEPEKYKPELTDKLSGLVYCHIADILRNYLPETPVYLSGSKQDPGKQIKNKPILLHSPMQEYVSLLDSALKGYKPLVIWEPRTIPPPTDPETLWLPCPVILYFFEIGNFIWDHTKENRNF